MAGQSPAASGQAGGRGLFFGFLLLSVSGYP
jgi:hypothetical protein